MRRFGNRFVTVLCALALFGGLAAIPGGCAEQFEAPHTEGRDIRLTILHTTDIHSRLLPYDMTVLAGDQRLGLDQDMGPFGGIARVAHIINRERERAPRTLYVDSGDCFQGAPIFNAFLGEIEQRAMTLMRPDAVVIGNHEFDEGIRNYVTQLQRWAAYPLIAANYMFEPGEPLADLAHPVEIVNVDGLRIGIIGVANFSSISSITDVGNSMHIVPLEIHQIVQDWIDILDPHVDLTIAVSHAGLGEDEELIKNTVGLDAIMGGHLHVVLNPPKVIKDKAGRDVILAHSGAFAKFVGRLDVVVRDGNIVAHDYQVFPIDSTVPEDPEMANLVEPYRLKLNQLIDLESVFGYSSKLIRRFDFDGGDSPLGNTVAEAIRQYARADFGMTNSLGIRTDLNPGAVSLDQLFNIFPFNNYVTTMYLSGEDVQALLDYVTLRSAGRGCATQIQVSGIEFVMDCRAASDECPDCPRARDIFFTDCGDPSLVDKTGCTRVPLQENAVYEMATNDYIAEGGSGFTVLKTNNTQIITDVALRDAVLERVIRSPACVEECSREDGTLLLDGCVGYESCVRDLSAFYARRCQNARDTNPGEQFDLDHCSVQIGGDCRSREECYARDGCTPELCTTCTSNAACAEQGLECIDGFCRKPGLVCSNRRCQRICESDDECPGQSVVGDSGQHLCVAGVCHPRAGAACSDDASCIDVQAVCGDGNCQPCTATSPDSLVDPSGVCAPGELCVDNFCVVPVASCLDNRCRARCADDSECGAGERCNEVNHCVPTLCDRTDFDAQTECEAEAQWRALERCLTVPCPTAFSDGRISRILPENLEDLPSDIDPDDPEG